MPAPIEYRIRLNYTGPTMCIENADVLLGAWEDAHPQFGPVLSYDTDHDVADITIALEAFTPEHAITTALGYERDIRNAPATRQIAGYAVIPVALED